MRGLIFLKHVQEQEALYREKRKDPARTLEVLVRMGVKALDN